MEHDTVNKFIIVWGSDSFGSNVEVYASAVTNESNTTHFTATSIEEHHVHEMIVDFFGHNSPVVTPLQVDHQQYCVTQMHF